MTNPQKYSDLGIDSPLQPEEYPQKFTTAFDEFQENRDLIEREGAIIDF